MGRPVRLLGDNLVTTAGTSGAPATTTWLGMPLSTRNGGAALGMRRWCARVGMLAAVGAVTLASTAGVASAHVEVKADKAQAGATDVTVSFDAEAESTSAGVVSLRVVLPSGIAPTDVTYVSGPPGWT